MKRSDIEKLEKAKGILYQIDILKAQIKYIDNAIEDCDENPNNVEILIRSTGYNVSIQATKDRDTVLSSAKIMKGSIEKSLNDLNKEFEEL